MAVFEELNALNINGHAEIKKVEGKELTYLSWPWAWAEVKKRYPNAHYSIWKNEKGLPYTEDPMTGYMVYTSVTIGDVTHEMWLPVMNGANRAMKREPYEYTTKYGKKSVEAATMMDINKAIMRCLVKNLAMFGLGLYIYAGEDLPETEKEEQEIAKAQTAAVQAKPAQRTAPKAEVAVGGAVPPVASEGAKGASKKQMSEGAAFLVQAKAKIERDIPGFDFAKARQELVARGEVENVPSAVITLDQASTLISKMYEKYGKAAS